VTQKLSYTQSELFASTLPEIQDTDNIMSLSDPDRSQFVDLSGDNISSKLSLILCLCILHGRVTLRPSIHKLLSRTDRQSAMHNAPKQESHITNEKHLLPIIPNWMTDILKVLNLCLVDKSLTATSCGEKWTFHLTSGYWWRQVFPCCWPSKTVVTYLLVPS